MNYQWKSAGSIVLAGLLTLTLAACGSTGTETNEAPSNEDGIKISGESLDVNDIALRPDGQAAQIYERGNFKLLVPLEYDSLVVVDTSRDDVIFDVSEKASIDAAKAQGIDTDGAGWLFSIGTVTEDALHEALCYDMSGEEVFAKGADGQYYMYYHPTDVRIVREDYENMPEEDMKQWTALNEWASTVPETFITENSGLTAERRGNTALDMYLARIAYMDGTKYTISATEHGPMDGSGFDAKPYIDQLTDGNQVIFASADDAEVPDEEYIVLSFPDDDIRFDFFAMEGKEHYIRQVWGGDNEILYRAVFEDGEHAADISNVMWEWYNALVAANADGTANNG